MIRPRFLVVKNFTMDDAPCCVCAFRATLAKARKRAALYRRNEKASALDVLSAARSMRGDVVAVSIYRIDEGGRVVEFVEGV